MTGPKGAGGGVQAVLDRAANAAIYERDMHDANDNTPAADGWESLRADLRATSAAVADLIVKAERVAGWLDAQAIAAERRAQDTRFPSLAEANAADARNYRATAKDLRAALAKAGGES